MAHPRTFTAYPRVREVVSPEYESLSDQELASVIASEAGVTAEFVENWLSNIGRAITHYAPGVLSGIATGAVSGAPFGGPIGALAGGLLGGITGAMRTPPPGAQPTPGPGAPVTAGAPAAGALMQMFANPSVRQALMSMLMGPRVGAPTVAVGREGVPVAAFANMIREAADQALAQYELAGGAPESDQDLPGYLEADRRRGADTGSAFVRGVVLAKLLDQPTYVPVAATPPQTTVVYPQPGTVATAQPGVPGAAPMPVAPGAAPGPTVDPYGFEPPPQYGTPDLGIGQPIPTQAERAATRRNEAVFQETLDAIFELDEVTA
jgi:hypothetical protein